MTDAPARAWGAQSMIAPLREALVHRPGAAFGAAFENPDNGFLVPVDLLAAQWEHDAFVDLLVTLGVQVDVLEAETDDPDLVYTFDPLLVTDRGAIPLRPGKPNRRGEPALLEAWTEAAGIPSLGRIEAPGTIEGGDTLWLRRDLLCIGRSLRTNDAGARQLAEIVGGDVRIFDVPYWRGAAELVHLLSVISPVTDDLAVIYPPLLPAGLWELLGELGIQTIPVPEDEYPTLACNVLAVRPGVLVMADGNPVTRVALEAAGCEVHLPGGRDRDQWLRRSDLHGPSYTPGLLIVSRYGGRPDAQGIPRFHPPRQRHRPGSRDRHRRGLRCDRHILRL